VHLAYELAIENPGAQFVTLDKVEAIDPTSGSSLSNLSGDSLSRMIAMHSGDGNRIAPGGSAAVFMDVSFPHDERLPVSVAARITATRQGVGADGKPAPFPPEAPVPATYSFTGARIDVGQPARVIDPPLRGAGWMATNGCCDRMTPHRKTILAVNGAFRVPERFAIDWIQLDANNRAFEGDGKKLTSWRFYGAPIYSVADGTVVNLFDGADEQIPGPHPVGIRTDNIGGNMVVVDIGQGAYAFYAHMQRGSLRVRLGQQVKAGQILGLLGNTGNSTAPHLHFHLMDSPSPLNSNGIPYVFRHFTSVGTGYAGDEDALEEGKAARIDSRLAGDHVNQLPLDNEVVTFK
jgi:hypothetical protein